MRKNKYERTKVFVEEMGETQLEFNEIGVNYTSNIPWLFNFGCKRVNEYKINPSNFIKRIRFSLCCMWFYGGSTINISE